MDERERMLATAWRDLAGPHEGMVYVDGSGHRMVTARYHPPSPWLPDPDAPANWGVWLAWCAKRFGLGAVCMSNNGPAQARTGLMPWDRQDMEVGRSPAASLMAATCRHLDFMRESNGTTWGAVPPSVTAWWEAEKTSHTPAT